MQTIDLQDMAIKLQTAPAAADGLLFVQEVTHSLEPLEVMEVTQVDSLPPSPSPSLSLSLSLCVCVCVCVCVCACARVFVQLSFTVSLPLSAFRSARMRKMSSPC